MTIDTGNAECFSKKDGFTFGTTFDKYKLLVNNYYYGL